MMDLEVLEKLAREASSLPWAMVDARAFLEDEDFEIRNGGHCIGYGTSAEDAAYIVAACNAVLELIARERKLQAENADLKARIKAADEAIKGLLEERRES